MSRRFMGVSFLNPMPGLCLCLCLLVLAAFPSAAAESSPETEDSKPKLSAEDLNWIAGHWMGEVQGSTVEESWSAAAANTLMGMFRWHDGSQIRLFEFMTLEIYDGEPILYLRHFSPALKAWEEKDKPMIFDRVESGSQHIVFQERGSEDSGLITQLTYEREGENLVATLSKVAGEKRRDTVFTYKPVLTPKNTASSAKSADDSTVSED